MRFYLFVRYDTLTISDYTASDIVTISGNELESLWKVAVDVYWKVGLLSYHVLGVTDGNHDAPQSG